MAEYRDEFEKIRLAGAGVLALAVDEPVRSEAVRRQLQLPFPILCDTRRAVVEAWGLLDAREKGGIAKPAVFAVDRDRRVRFSSVDREAARVPARTVVNFLLSGMTGPPGPPRRRIVFTGLGDWMRALGNTFRFGTRSPRS